MTNKISSNYINECNQQIQQELFILPFRTYLTAKLDSFELYSSDTLKRKYIDAMKNTGRCKPIGSDIERMINNELLNPVWLNKGVFSLTVFKLFAPDSQKNIAGFFSPTHNKIFILIDNSISFGFASDYELANTTIHECMHMSAKKMGYSFMNFFKEEFSLYYAAFFQRLFSINTNIFREAEIFSKVAFKLFESRPFSTGYISKIVPSYLKTIEDLLIKKSTLNNIEFQQTLNDLGKFLILFDLDMDRFMNSIRNYQHVYSSLVAGYVHGLNIRPKNLLVQELVFPSEVISCYSETANPSKLGKVYKAFKKI